MDEKNYGKNSKTIGSIYSIFITDSLLHCNYQDSKAASSHSHCLETVPESSTVSQKSEINVSSSTTAAKFGNSVTGTIAENSKALIKSASGFTKPSVSQTKHNKDHSALGMYFRIFSAFGV